MFRLKDSRGDHGDSGDRGDHRVRAETEMLSMSPSPLKSTVTDHAEVL